MKAPVYVVKPKNIYRHPFNKYDLDKPTSRETQNEDLTDYFNYGFNEDTMNIYAKLVKRTIQALDENVNPTYFDAASELMRLNDEIPIDFGGFCKFFDTSIFHNPDNQEGLQNMQNFHNGEELVQFLIALILGRKPEYPLLQFVENLYRKQEDEENGICDVMDQIERNLDRKYKQVMLKLLQKKNPASNTQKADEKPKNEEKRQQMQKKYSQSAEDSSDSDDSDDSSSSESRPRSRQRRKSRRKEKSRSREKRRKRSRSRDKKRKSHRSKKDRRDRKRSYERSKKSKDRRKEKDRKHRRR